MRRLSQALFVLLLFISAIARAGEFPIGVLSYDVLIPSSPGAPGVDAFNLSNLTGGFDLPPDFPVATGVTWDNTYLTLTLLGDSQEVVLLGNISPGPLLDSSGNPLPSLQFPDTTQFLSAAFTGTLDLTNLTLFDGGTFSASHSISFTLLPSSGSTLVAGTDAGVIQASPSSVPEPSTGLLLLTLLLMTYRIRRGSPRAAK